MKSIVKFLSAAAITLFPFAASMADTIPSGFSRPLLWSIGAELSPAFVPGSVGFSDDIDYIVGLSRGGSDNQPGHVRGRFSASVKAAFRFAGDTREGMLYPGVYQGFGIGLNSFFPHSQFGTPVSAYVYQGAPIVRLSSRLSLGYEWKFGAAFGWKHHYDDEHQYIREVSTSVTAMLAAGLNLRYSLSDRLTLAFGLEAAHFSNGNTSMPNSGINSIGATAAITYLLYAPRKNAPEPDAMLVAEADKGRWIYDIVAYGAWRRRIVDVGDPVESELCPGRFGVAGLQFSPMRTLNRWVAVGPALDLQWDESAGLAPYWVDGSHGENIKFQRPPFGKQIKAGLSAHAELTMPVFCVNAGLGYDFVNPQGDSRFYQSLTLKTFVTSHVFLNVGYRLGKFKNPQNLMLGIGVRL